MSDKKTRKPLLNILSKEPPHYTCLIGYESWTCVAFITTTLIWIWSCMLNVAQSMTHSKPWLGTPHSQLTTPWLAKLVWLKRCCYSWGIPSNPQDFLHPNGTLTLLLLIREVPLLPRTSLHSPRHLKSPNWGYLIGGDVAIPLDFSTFLWAILNSSPRRHHYSPRLHDLPNINNLDFLRSHSSPCINSSLESKDVKILIFWNNLLNLSCN
jgi:hypothetical protein